LASAIVLIHPDAVKNVREIKLIDLRSEKIAGVVTKIVGEQSINNSRR
jgi:hypothetical protein